MSIYLVSKEFDDARSLSHHGVKGMKRGVRQYQNKDGSLTPEGRIHYGIGEPRKAKGSEKKNGGTDDSEYRPKNARLLKRPEMASVETRQKMADTLSKPDSERTREENMLIFNQILDRSGNFNSGDAESKGYEDAYRVLENGYEKTNARRDEIAEQIGYRAIPDSVLPFQHMRHVKREEKLEAALKADKIYQALLKNDRKNEEALCEAVLKDIGIPVTSENIAAIFSYVFYL